MNKMCVFWEYENPVNTWLSRGCSVVPQESTNDVTSCLCTHLTLFAVLMDPYNIEVRWLAKKKLYTTYCTFRRISIPHWPKYFYRPTWHKTYGTIAVKMAVTTYKQSRIFNVLKDYKKVVTKKPVNVCLIVTDNNSRKNTESL